MPVEFEARRRPPAFVLFYRVQIVASERVWRVRLCESGRVHVRSASGCESAVCECPRSFVSWRVILDSFDIHKT